MTSLSMQPCCRAARHALQRRARSAAVAGSALGSSRAAFASTSTSASSSYTRPIPQGTLPIYDEALAYIETDKQEKLDVIDQAKKNLAELTGTSSDSTRSQLQEELQGLEIASLINDPEIRWRFRTGQVDMSKPVYRYLTEQAWRENGDLGILMQRISQMHVVPDVIGRIQPLADVRVAIQDGLVEPGSYIKPSQTIEQPAVTVQVFHQEERLYTVLLVDPDSPHAEVDGYKTKCHWALANLPLSAANAAIDTTKADVVASYVPPHPEQGTPYHRYTVVLLQQSDRVDCGKARQSLEGDLRENVNVRDFVEENQLEPVGITFFRQKWDDSVGKIFEEKLGKSEPKYGRSPKADRFARFSRA